MARGSGILAARRLNTAQPLHPPPGDTSTKRTVQIDGTNEQIESGFRPPRPPTNWGPPGPPPMQQPRYGYMQPGAYPGPPPRYNMSQGSYSGYPTPQTSGAYPSGWDQTSALANPQSTSSGGYDYYSQQPLQQHQQTPGGSSAPADNNAYNYGQPPPSNYNPQKPYGGESNYSQPPVGQQQGYGQDGYGGGYSVPGPQPGYGQPQSNPQSRYDHQGYVSAPTYGNPTQDGAHPSYGGKQALPQVNLLLQWVPHLFRHRLQANKVTLVNSLPHQATVLRVAHSLVMECLQHHSLVMGANILLKLAMAMGSL